jgi:PKD domain-containing protein
MTRKPGFWKWTIGVTVLSLLFIAALASTSASLTSAKITHLNTTLNVIGAAKAAPTPTGTDLITSVLELDGNITDASPGPTPDDWDTLNCDGGNALVKTGVIHDGLGKSIYTGGGSKDPEALASWRWKDGSVPDKDEIINAYAAKYLGTPSGDDILVFGADRYDNSGTAFMGFWFFKQTVFPAEDGRFRQGPLATDPLSVHQLGDVLVLIEFTNGGAVATAKVFEWVGTGGSESGGTLNDITGTAPVGSVFSISNAAPQQIPGTCPAWDYTPKGGVQNGPISVNSFFEGAINLNAFPALAGACFSSFLVETRSSSVVTATLKDFALGQFNTCASIEVSKTADNTAVCDGHSTTFTYVAHNTSGVTLDVTLVDDNGTSGNTADDFDVPTCMPLSALPLSEPTHFSLQPNDGAAGGADEQTFTCNRLLSVGTHTNKVTATGTFGTSSATATDTETVVVSPNPTADAGPDQSVCDTSPHVFTMAGTVTGAPPGTITWSVDSNTTGAAVQISDVNAEDPTVTLNGFGSVTLKLFVSNPATGPSCVTAQDTVTVTLSQNPAANAGVDKQACETNPSHVFSLSDATSTVPAGATRTWSVTANTTGATVLISDVNAANPTVTLQGFGSATLTQTITNPATGTGCTGASDSVNLTLDQNPVVTIADVACTAAGGGTTLQLTAVVSAGGGPGTTFSWSGPSGGIVSGGSTDTITVGKPGTYTVTVTNGNTTCSSMKSKNVGLCAADAGP